MKWRCSKELKSTGPMGVQNANHHYCWVLMGGDLSFDYKQKIVSQCAKTFWAQPAMTDFKHQSVPYLQILTSSHLSSPSQLSSSTAAFKEAFVYIKSSLYLHERPLELLVERELCWFSHIVVIVVTVKHTQAVMYLNFRI